MNLFCRHRWEISRTDTMPSPFEQMTDAYRNRITSVDSTSVMFRKKIVYHYLCSKCGDVRMTTVTNP